jgi:hypothetical protein
MMLKKTSSHFVGCATGISTQDNFGKIASQIAFIIRMWVLAGF